MSAELKKYIWEKAIPLQRAARAIMSLEDRKRYDDAKKRCSMIGLAEALKSFKAVPPEPGCGNMMEILAPISEASDEASRLETAAHERLRDAGAAGKLHLYGIEPPVRLNSPAEELPINAWQGNLIWHKGRIDIGEMKFFELRFATPAIVQRLTAAFTTEMGGGASLKSRGPQSCADQAHAAYCALREEGAINFGASLAQNILCVRERMCRDNPAAGYNEDAEKPSERTIREYIKDEFNRDRIALRKAV